MFGLDNGYFDQDAYRQLIPTAWIPFVDANKQNGGLQVYSTYENKLLINLIYSIVIVSYFARDL